MKRRNLRVERLERREVLNGVTAVCMLPHTPPLPTTAALVAPPLALNAHSAATVQQPATVVAPTITAIGGVTNNNTGISNGKITGSWVPQRGDQLVWSVASTGGKHTGVITSVSKTVSGNQTVYSLVISQMNANCDNRVTTFNTTFTVTRQKNGTLIVSALPKFSTNSSGAYGYDR